MLFSILKFFFKFLLFSLVWTYMGRAIGIVYLFFWILIVIMKKGSNKNSSFLNLSWKSKDGRLQRSFPQYY